MFLKLLYKMQKSYIHMNVSICGHTYNAMVADTFSKRAIGLMFRKSLGKKACMLFIFHREARYGIWMHNMLFPIDILWLDSKMRVVDMVKGATPCRLFDCITYVPKHSARYIIEFNSGAIDKMRIKPNTKAAVQPPYEEKRREK